MACGLVYKVDLVGSAYWSPGQEALCKDFSLDTRRLFILPWEGIYPSGRCLVFEYFSEDSK